MFTRRDYRRRVHGAAGYAAFLRAVFAGSTVLFLGFSFEDYYLNEFRSEVLALLGRGRHDGDALDETAERRVDVAEFADWAKACGRDPVEALTELLGSR